jgi:hypothetical protein
MAHLRWRFRRIVSSSALVAVLSLLSLIARAQPGQTVVFMTGLGAKGSPHRAALEVIRAQLGDIPIRVVVEAVDISFDDLRAATMPPRSSPTATGPSACSGWTRNPVAIRCFT